MTSRERYEKARNLIQSGQLKEARNLLVPIRDEAQAADWIRKIDAHLARTLGNEQPSTTGRRTLVGGTTILFVLLALLTFLAGLVVGGYALDLNPEPTAEPVQIIAVVTATPPPTLATLAPATTPVATEPRPVRFRIPTITVTPTYTLVPTFTLTTTEIQSPKPESDFAISGNWLMRSEVSALDDSTAYYLGVIAENSVRAWLGNVTPRLIISCRHHQYEVYIYADTQLESNLDDEVFARVRYGTNPPVPVTMIESTGGDAMFFPQGAATVRQLLTIDRIVVGFTPFNAAPVEAIFDVTGLETAIQPLIGECGRP